MDAVKQMGPKPGERVVNADDSMEQSMKEALGEKWESVAGQFPSEFEVSSIREDGHVYFKRGSRRGTDRYLEMRTTPDATK